MKGIIIALMLAFPLMTYFERVIMSIAGPDIMKEFGITETQMGSVYSAFIFSYAALMIPGGRVADQFGPRGVLTAVMLGSALFTGLTAFGGRPGLGAYLGIVPSFLLIRLALGVFTAPLYPACARMNANWFSVEKRASVWGIVGSGAGLGSALSPILFSWTIARFGWRVAFGLAGSAAASLGVVWHWYSRDHPAEHPSLRAREFQPIPQAAEAVAAVSVPRTRFLQLLANRNLMLLTAGYFTVGYFEYIFYMWIYYYFKNIRHFKPSESGIYSTVIFLVMTVMDPLGGWVTDVLVQRYGTRTGRRMVPIVSLSICAILMFLGTRSANPIAATALLAFSLGFEASTDGPFWSSLIDVAGDDVGAAGGIMNTGSNLGSFIAPMLTPYIASRADWSWGLYTGSLVVLLGLPIWFVVDSTRGVSGEERFLPPGSNGGPRGATAPGLDGC